MKLMHYLVVLTALMNLMKSNQQAEGMPRFGQIGTSSRLDNLSYSKSVRTLGTFEHCLTYHIQFKNSKIYHLSIIRLYI